jgi:hypothetical protein
MLVIGTHGRGVWVFDGEQLDPRKAKGIGEVSDEDLPLLLGTWNGEVDADGRLMPFSLEFLMEDEEIGGSMEFVMGTATVSEVQFDGELLAFKATFSMGEQEMTTEFDGQIEEETMTGTGESPMGKSKLTATKEADESASTE